MIKIRKFSLEDYSELCHLWQTVFGDDTAFVGDFLTSILLPERAFVADDNGHIVAAAFIIDGISVGDIAYPYIYAVSTLPEYRGGSLGSILSIACGDVIAATGDVPALHPAEPSLFSWYSKIDYAPICSVREAEFTALADDSFDIQKISAGNYGAIREKMLNGTKSASFSDKLLEWQISLGMEYFCYDGGCMAAYCYDGKVVIPELLSKQSSNDAISALCARYGTALCYVRTPALDSFEGFGETVDFISAYGKNEQIDYWGFVFD